MGWISQEKRIEVLEGKVFEAECVLLEMQACAKRHQHSAERTSDLLWALLDHLGLKPQDIPETTVLVKKEKK